MKIIVLAGKGNSTNTLLNKIHEAGYSDVLVVLEQSVGLKKVVKYKIKKHGIVNFAGQILFMKLAKPFIDKASHKRIEEIENQYQINQAPCDKYPIVNVDSVNDEAVLNLLKNENYGLILVNGTRIIKSDIINAAKSIIANTHVGITPKYRGVHGGYWSCCNQDLENFGTTLHYVDAGVDTGEIIAQETTMPDKRDNFSTYPVLQQAIILPKIIQLIKSVEAGESIEKVSNNNTPSKQWFHPTLFQYVYNFLVLKVK